MSQKIQFRRGTDVARQSTIFDQGEPVYTTDSKRMYIGDGVTLGGNEIGSLTFQNNASFTSYIPPSGNTPKENASGLYLQMVEAWEKTPYGKPLSKNNQYTVLVYPGQYDFSDLFPSDVNLNRKPFVNIIGVGDKENIVFGTNNTPFVVGWSGNWTLANLTLTGANAITRLCYFSSTSPYIDNVELRDLNILAKYSTSDAIGFTSNGVPINCRFVNINTSGGLGSQASANGSINCIYENLSINANGIGFFNGIYNQYAPYSGNLIKNSRFYAPNVYCAFYSDFDSIGMDSSNLFKNCHFSGQDFFQDLGSSQAYFCKFENCHFDSYIMNGFRGVMENCTINSKGLNYQCVTVDNTNNKFPSFYNCTFLADNSIPAVTGSTSSTTGLFLHCRANRPISQFVTGGNIAPQNYTIVNSRIV